MSSTSTAMAVPTRSGALTLGVTGLVSSSRTEALTARSVQRRQCHRVRPWVVAAYAAAMVSGALRRHGLSVAGIITALVLGACSSSQSGVEAATTTAQSALGASTASKIEFLEGGNSICVEVGANLATFDREVRRQGASGAAIAKLLNGYAEFQTTILEKLQALQQPPHDDGQ